MDNGVQNLLKLVVVESSTVDLALYLMYHKIISILLFVVDVICVLICHRITNCLLYRRGIVAIRLPT